MGEGRRDESKLWIRWSEETPVFALAPKACRDWHCLQNPLIFIINQWPYYALDWDKIQQEFFGRGRRSTQFLDIFQFAGLAVEDGMDGKQGRVEGNKGRFCSGAQLQVDVDVIEAQIFQNRIAESFRIVFNLVRCVASGHEAGSPLQSVFV